MQGAVLEAAEQEAAEPNIDGQQDGALQGDYLASFIPKLVVRGMAERGALAESPHERRGEAALLMIDLAGFTRLTGRFAQDGDQGAEALSELITDYFDGTGRLIEDHGGELLLFGGDSVLALFRADDGLNRATRRAAAAADAIHRRPIAGIEDDARTLRYAAVTAGTFAHLEVGGTEGRWVPLFIGSAVTQLHDTLTAADRGGTAASQEAWALLQATCEGASTSEGPVRLNEIAEVERSSTDDRPDIAPELARAYLPPAIADVSTRDAARWMAEFRNVTIAFINLRDVGDGEDTLQRIQHAVETAQQELIRYGGTLYQAVADDKGISLILGFGLPPATNERSAEHAVRATDAIRTDLLEAGLDCAVGIATGQMFTGICGGPALRHYAVIGPAINLSARLMQTGADGVLLDEATMRAAGPRLTFEAMPDIEAKGFSEPVGTFRFTGLAETAPLIGAMESSLFGRDEEAARLDDTLNGLLDGETGHGGGAVVVSGEAGIGKSVLLSHFAARAGDRGVRIVTGGGDAIERSTRLYGWRPILRQLIAPGIADPDAEELKTGLAEALADEPRLAEWAPLLDDILSLDMPDNEITAQMDAVARDESVRRLVIHLLTRAADVPTAIVLDDAHWCDSTSLSLFAAAALVLPNMLFVIGARPEFEEAPAAFRAVLEAPDTIRIDLDGLTVEAVEKVAAARLGVEALPHGVASFLAERAEGNPFYTEELALALLETGAIEVHDGRVDDRGLDPERAATLPAGLQGVVTSRIDRLPGPALIAAKAASVIGRVFGTGMLRALYPSEAGAELDPQLSTLAEQALVLALGATGANGALDDTAVAAVASMIEDGNYAFRHILIRDAAYALMVASQRKELHALAAEWIARKSEGHETPHDKPWGVLAYHHDRAEALEQAFDAYEKAALAAVESYANSEAIAFCTRALEIADVIDVDASRRAMLHWGLGRAHHGMTDYAKAHEAYAKALAGFGHAVPDGKGATATQLIREAVAQRGLRKREVPPQEANERHGTAISTMRLWQECALFMGDALTSLSGIYRYLNMAERAGDVAERLHGYGHLSIMLNVLGLKASAARYNARAMRLMETHDLSLHDRSYGWEVAVVYHSSAGEWDRLEEALREGEAGFSRLGDRFRRDTLYSLRGYGELARHQLDAAEAALQTGYDSAFPDGAEQVMVWCLGGLAFTHVLQGRPDATIATELRRRVEGGLNVTEALLAHGAAAATFDALGDRGAAERSARDAVGAMEGATHVFPYLRWPTGAAADILLDAYERTRDPETLAKARVAVKTLAGLGRINRTVRPAADRITARLAVLTGKERKARKLLQRSIEGAEALAMPGEREAAETVLKSLG